MAGKTILNPAGALGYTDLETETYSATAPFVAGGNITAKKLVAIQTAGNSVITALTNAPSPVVGGALTAISSGQVGLVVVQGMLEDAVPNGTVAAADALKPSVTTAGNVQATATPAVGECVGFAVNASASSTVDVWISKSI